MNIVYQQFRTTGIKGFTRPLRWQHAELQELEGSEGFQTEAAPPYNGRITVSLSDAVHSLVQGQKTGGAGRIQGKTWTYRANKQRAFLNHGIVFIYIVHMSMKF